MSVPVDVVWAWADGRADQAATILRHEVARACGVGADTVALSHLCPSCGSAEHGKPFVTLADGDEAPAVSLGRGGDLVVVAFTIDGSIGVDIESADAPAFTGFDDVALHAGESASTMRDRAITWVRKESLLKATGHGLGVDPAAIQLSPAGEAPELLIWPAARPPEVWMRDLVIEPDHVVAVTVLGNPTKVRLWEAREEQSG